MIGSLGSRGEAAVTCELLHMATERLVSVTDRKAKPVVEAIRSILEEEMGYVEASPEDDPGEWDVLKSTIYKAALDYLAAHFPPETTEAPPCP